MAKQLGQFLGSPSVGPSLTPLRRLLAGEALFQRGEGLAPCGQEGSHAKGGFNEPFGFSNLLVGIRMDHLEYKLCFVFFGLIHFGSPETFQGSQDLLLGTPMDHLEGKLEDVSSIFTQCHIDKAVFSSRIVPSRLRTSS